MKKSPWLSEIAATASLITALHGSPDMANAQTPDDVKHHTRATEVDDTDKKYDYFLVDVKEPATLFAKKEIIRLGIIFEQETGIRIIPTSEEIKKIESANPNKPFEIENALFNILKAFECIKNNDLKEALSFIDLAHMGKPTLKIDDYTGRRWVAQDYYDNPFGKTEKDLEEGAKSDNLPLIGGKGRCWFSGSSEKGVIICVSEDTKK